MKHLKHTLETYVYSHNNICNIQIYFCNIQMKHLQHTYETPETLETCMLCNIQIYFCNIQIKHLKHTPEKQLKHLKHKLATCMYCHCNICNIT
jgi:hypothetical protein